MHKGMHLTSTFSSIFAREHSLLNQEEINFLVKECYSIKQNNKSGGNKWHCDVYNSNQVVDLIKEKSFDKIINLITDQVNLLSLKLGSKTTHKCNSCWFNIYEKGDYQEYHYHPSSIFSAIYVLKTPVPEPKIWFKHPVNDMYPLDTSEVNDLNAREYWFQLALNNVLIFRSYEQHMVDELKSEENRITLALNF